MSALISSAFPEHEWLPWKFGKVPKGYWESKENQRKFMKWLATQLSFKSIEDFYKLCLDVILFIFFTNFSRMFIKMGGQD
jgi:hypothetical protein